MTNVTTTTYPFALVTSKENVPAGTDAPFTIQPGRVGTEYGADLVLRAALPVNLPKAVAKVVEEEALTKTKRIRKRKGNHAPLVQLQVVRRQP